MALTINTRVYNFDTQITSDATRYNGPSNTTTVKDVLSLKRNVPKTVNGVVGVHRHELKSVYTQVDANGNSDDVIITTTISRPHRVTDANLDLVRVTHAAALSGTVGADLIKSNKVNQG